MRVTLTALLRDAWQSWRRDWEVLVGVAGPFVFLPALALLLLVPDAPVVPAGADPAVPASFGKYPEAMADWLLTYGPWIIAAQFVSIYGQFAMVGLYLSDAQANVGTALLAALRRLPSLMLALIIVAIPTTLVAAFFVVAPVLLPGAMIAIVLITARALLVMPVLHAESPIGAFAAVIRSLRATHGSTLMLATTVLTIYLAIHLLSWPFFALDHWLVKEPNPVARTVFDSVQAAMFALAAITMALVQVAAYRRLSSR